jgi:xanthine dehydrogenase accessory factor
MFEQIYKELLEKIESKGETALLTFLSIENSTIIKKQVIAKNELDDENNPLLKESILKVFETGLPYTYVEKDQSILIEPFYPKPRLVIFGGGHIAKPLTEFGRKVGFSIMVVDDRPFFANPGRFPDADQIICEDFNKVFDKINLRPSDFVIIVTRGHKYDGVCLRNSLKYTTAYIGMIGSKRRVKAMMNELEEEGFDKEKLDKVCSPIGLDIGAVTPEEIAIAIIAQVISYRRSSAYRKSNKFNWPEFDMDVLKEASSSSDVPRALITIIGSKGSVPRKAGAKMIVWLDGRLIGTIGGGCSEANILTLSRNVIQEKGYKIEHVDMTGDVAEDEGMVCGGIMDVLIEAID